MGEDHDDFSNFDANYLIITILDLLEGSLFRMWAKKELHRTREKYFFEIESIRRSHMKLILNKKYIDSIGGLDFIVKA